jgi:hypothetical protein
MEFFRTVSQTPQVEVYKKGRGTPFVFGEITHQHVENIVIQREFQLCLASVCHTIHYSILHYSE